MEIAVLMRVKLSLSGVRNSKQNKTVICIMEHAKKIGSCSCGNRMSVNLRGCK